MLGKKPQARTPELLLLAHWLMRSAGESDSDGGRAWATTCGGAITLALISAAATLTAAFIGVSCKQDKSNRKEIERTGKLSVGPWRRRIARPSEWLRVVFCCPGALGSVAQVPSYAPYSPTANGNALDAA